MRERYDKIRTPWGEQMVQRLQRRMESIRQLRVVWPRMEQLETLRVRLVPASGKNNRNFSIQLIVSLNK
jgi:hypothetical protein